MPAVPLLAYYCALILVASIVGGMIPVWFQLTHRWMQIAVSFVSGVMLGVGVLHMLPHALVDAALADNVLAGGAAPTALSTTTLTVNIATVQWISVSLLAGMLVMFFIERFCSYHHHDVPEDLGHEHSHHNHEHEHSRHDMSWSGAALGLALHSALNGVALAAAVQHGSHGSWLAGLGTFLVIFLHKPFDAMTISMLMDRGGWSVGWRQLINGLFALAIPIGALIFYFGLMTETAGPDTANRQWYIACALAFSAGTFLCISLSDLLPELQFHSHDRLKLSVALLLGLVVAELVSQMESYTHAPHMPPPAATQSNP